MNQELAPVHRFAIYLTSRPDDAWWKAGSGWLGRCARQNTALQQPAVPLLPEASFAELTAEPRRYGWHATLKAPFQLAEDASAQDLLACVMKVAQQQKPFHVPDLQVSRMGNFLALRPIGKSDALQALADTCVTETHALARPLPVDELARRRRAGLTPQQEALLMAWGYPWVLSEFRFHFSLTGPLDHLSPHQLQALLEAAADHFHPLSPMLIDRLSVFIEPRAGQAFQLLEQFEFTQ